jgi:hypothetical protein
VADAPTETARDKICAETLLACCLVNRAWHRLAQPTLNQTVVINNTDNLNRWILGRSKDHHLGSLRYIVLGETWGESFTFNVDIILRALPNPHLLRSFVCYDGAQLPESSDARARELVGTSRFPPQPLDVNLSGLHGVLLGTISYGPNWLPFLLVAPNLRYLIFHGCGWCISSSIYFVQCCCA